MACPDISGRCRTGQDKSICCNHTAPYNFPELYYFNEVDTEDSFCCFLGIRNDGNQPCTGTDIGNEAADGRYCGFGCEDCDDSILRGGGLDQYEFVDGKRWLMPVPHLSQGRKRRNWDARGMIHDLRSNEYWPIPGTITYERGTCYDNDGTECFGADACACFGANTVDPYILHDDHCGGVGAGSPLPGLLPDEFFRTGFRWPPTSPGGSTQGGGVWHCRKFGETRIEEGGHVRSEVIVNPTNTKGLDGVTEGLMEPALLSSNVCQSDRMAECTGVLASGSPCEFFSAYGLCTIDHTEDVCKNTFYSAAHWDFDKLRLVPIVNPEMNAPHIISRNDDTSMLGGRTAAWKNTILDMVRTHEFPEEPEEGGAERVIRFDRLDHQAHIVAHNADVGLYVREWIGTPSTLVKVPSGSGIGRLRQAGCPFEYNTYITRVRIVCRLILQQHRPDDRVGGFINPLVRLHIIATTTMAIHNLHRQGDRGITLPCCFVVPTGPTDDDQPVERGRRGRGRPKGSPPVDPESDPNITCLDVRNEWTGSEYANVLYSSRDRTPLGPDDELRDPVTEPLGYGESFMFFGPDGRQFIPSRFVEWRGFLGGHSKPTSEDEKVETGTCTFIAEQFSVTVPGWPTNVDTPGGPEEDDPAGIYGGHVVLDFLE